MTLILIDPTTEETEPGTETSVLTAPQKIVVPELERTLWFVKPYIKPEMAARIIKDRNRLIKSKTRFSVIEQIKAPTLSLEGWLEFYSVVHEKYPDICLMMCQDFASCSYYLTGDIIEGDNIIDIGRWALGYSRKIEENPSWTIRGKYGRYNNINNLSWRTVAHASTPDEVEKDFRVFRKYGIITVPNI